MCVAFIPYPITKLVFLSFGYVRLIPCIHLFYLKNCPNIFYIMERNSIRLYMQNKRFKSFFFSVIKMHYIFYLPNVAFCRRLIGKTFSMYRCVFGKEFHKRLIRISWNFEFINWAESTEVKLCEKCSFTAILTSGRAQSICDLLILAWNFSNENSQFFQNKII